MTEDRDNLLRQLTNLCRDMAKGHYAKVEELFELTKEGKYPPLIAEPAETFGLMMVKMEAGEYRPEQVIDALQKAKDDPSNAKKRLSEENVHLKKGRGHTFTSSGFLGTSPQIRDLVAKVEKVADAPVNVLITGETGT
jgi:transcriptional regulator with PAS, ATPase and Fis domain